LHEDLRELTECIIIKKVNKMEQEIMNPKVEIEVRELEEMKAEAAQMKLNMRNLTEELVRTKDELDVTKKDLFAISKNLLETKQLLHASVELQGKAEETATRCEHSITTFLSRWLTVKSMSRLKAILRFYYPVERVKMIDAVLTYLLFGKKFRMESEVENTHFKLICEMIDEDCITLPAHSLMVKLMQKYGLNEELKEVARQSSSNKDIVTD